MHNKPITSLGVTLPELMTTVCISGILASVAIPGFKDIITSNRSTSIANQLVTALNYARSEAIKRGLQVTIKHKDATPREWEKGWDIFTDSNSNGTIDMSDQLLKTYEALPEGYTISPVGWPIPQRVSAVAQRVLPMTRLAYVTAQEKASSHG